MRVRRLASQTTPYPVRFSRPRTSPKHVEIRHPCCGSEINLYLSLTPRPTISHTMALETTLEPWYPAPARCNRCFDVFPSKNKASEHAKIAGHLPADIVRICTDCGEMFGKNSEQRKHADLTGHMNGRLATGQIAVPSAPFSSRTSVGSDPPVPFASAHVSAEDSQVAHSAALTTSGCPLCGQEVPVDRVHVCHSPAHQSCPICLAQFESNAEVVDHITNASSCSTCKICLPPSQQLEDHYWDSLLHPKCRPCALAFKDHDEWGAHKINCPVAPRKGQKAKQSLRAHPPPRMVPCPQGQCPSLIRTPVAVACRRVLRPCLRQLRRILSRPCSLHPSRPLHLLSLRCPHRLYPRLLGGLSACRRHRAYL
ncbi:hypothetical protein C8Q80DRAFT_750918 [Daedaleopsis nitida]|nr:hypothetical protein C8Q80DRAFT_750918 [Daedaleopsis nitida]